MYVPGFAVALVTTISGDVAAPPGGGVIGEVIDSRTPEGALPIHEVVKVTVELKPLRGLIVIVADTVPPWTNVIVEVEEPRVKSAIFAMLVLLVVV
jgi:hypothetical protein